VCIADATNLSYAAGISSATLAEATLSIATAVRLLGVCCSAVAALLHHEETLVEAHERERQLEQTRRELFRFVFHELRVPLNTLVLGLDQLDVALSRSGQHLQGLSPVIDARTASRD